MRKGEILLKYFLSILSLKPEYDCFFVEEEPVLTAMLRPSDRFLVTATAAEACEIETESYSFHLCFFPDSIKSGIPRNGVIIRTLSMSSVIIHGVIS